MNKEQETSWQGLATAWRATDLQPADPAALGERIRNQRTRTALAHAFDVAGAVALIVALAWFAWRSPDSWTLAFAAIQLAVVAAVVAATTWNRRDLWQPAADSVRGHLAWSIRRCRRQLRTVRIAWVLYAVQAVAVPLLVALHPRAGIDAGRIAFTLAFLVAFALVLAAWSRWYARRVQRDLAGLLALQAELD